MTKTTRAPAATPPGLTEETESQQDGLADQAVLLERMLPALSRQILWVATKHPLADLPLAQLRLCSLLLQEGRRTMSQIGEDLGISVSAVTQMADRLEKVGMVERVAEAGGDRRTRHLCLTTHGEVLMRSRQEMRTQRACDTLRHLSPEQREQVLESLSLLVEASKSLESAAPPFRERV